MPTIQTLFADVLPITKGIFFAGRELTESVVHTEIQDEERKAIETVFYSGLSQIEKVSPKIAGDIRPQLPVALKAAGVFKEMLPEKKDYSFPSVAGSLGVAWLFPQAIRYVASPSGSNPAYTSYPANSWDISLTAGSAAHLFGDGTNFYKASPATGQHAMLIVFKNGVIEVGSTPKIDQFRLYAEGITKYGIYTVAPIVEEKIEENRLIYQYPTPLGPTIIPYDKGVMWSFMPRLGGTATIKLLGLVLYEHDLFSTLKWVS